MVVITVVVLFTLVSAAANLIPSHRPTTAELRAEELDAVADARRVRIAELREHDTHCDPAQAHELVRLLAFDGQWDELHAFGDRYERTCGTDVVVRHWTAAPKPHPRYRR